MYRESIGSIRPGYKESMYADGFVYNDTLAEDGNVVEYWREGPHYVLSKADVLMLEQAVKGIYKMCLVAGDYMLDNPEILERMGIPAWAIPRMRETWEANPPNVYGRYDLAYDGSGPPKLLEFNADTPTSLFESAYLQWRWFEFTQQGGDQWNSIEEQLIQAWVRNLGIYQLNNPNRVIDLIHFAWTTEETSGEDLMTTSYMADLAEKAAAKMGNGTKPDFRVKRIAIENIGIGEDGHFYDMEGEEIQAIFKLYPWEWLVHDKIADTLKTNLPLKDGTLWIEPIWKMMWSNKGLIVVLWKLFKDDPVLSKYLAPAFFADDPEAATLTSYVRKPLLAREGANMTVVIDGVEVERTSGQYGEEGYVVQQYVPLAAFEGMDGICHPVFGPWVVDGDPAGLGIRESVTSPTCAGLITNNRSYFVPHVIKEDVRHSSPVSMKKRSA